MPRTNTPPHIKWLLNERAALVGKALQLERQFAELATKRDKTSARISALDRAIALFDSSVSPTAVKPVNAWKGRYGARGELMAALRECLMAAAPSAVTTLELAVMLQTRFGLEFSHPAEQQRWRKNSLLRALKRLVALGEVQRLHEGERLGAHTSGRWRYREERPTLEALAAAAGVKREAS